MSVIPDPPNRPDQKRGRREHSPSIFRCCCRAFGSDGGMPSSMILMDADTESLSTHSAGHVEHQVQNSTNRIRQRHLRLHCSGWQQAIHHRALCWSGSWRHHRSHNHSSSTKDRSIHVKQQRLGGLHRISGTFDCMVGTRRFSSHTPREPPVFGHRRRCSVERVRKTRGWRCWSQCLWPWFFMLGGSPMFQLEVLQRNPHLETLFPFQMGGHSWTQSTFRRNC